MTMLVFQGTLVHAKSSDQPLQILENYLLGVNQKQIIFVAPAEELSELSKKYGFAEKDVRILEGRFLMPGFVDTHIHAPQYVFTGTGIGLPLLDWLNTYTFPIEAQFADIKFATDVYQKVVERTLKNGTTTASYYATIHKEATLKLAEIASSQELAGKLNLHYKGNCEDESAVYLKTHCCIFAAKFGQRAFIGKVNMDIRSPVGYIESTQKSLEDTEWFIKQVIALKDPLITAIITPRFAGSCTLELMTKLADLAKKFDLPIQTHLSENRDEVALMKKWFPESASYTDIYKTCGLLTNKTILAHCIYLDDKELEYLKDNGCGISHCACSNFSIKSGILDLRKLKERGLKLSLGTDVSGGYSPSMPESIRQSITASHVQEILNPGNECKKSLDFKYMFYLATLGGSEVMGLQEKVGNFEVGKDFDAILVNPRAPGSPFDVFHCDSTQDIVQKFLFLGDDRNIEEVHVAGRKVIPMRCTC